MTQNSPVVDPKDEKAHFEATYNVLLEHILADLANFNLPQNGREHIEKMIAHTLPGGKMNRGLAVVASVKELVAPREITERELFVAELLGWCIEMLQAFFLVADDIMDGSITRRGQPCWYRNNGVGLLAINDSFLLESFIYRLLRKHLRNEKYYTELLDLFHEVTYQTELGQLMDLITAPEDDVDLTRFSIQKHAYIVEYKTAYYSFYLPVACAMRMVGIEAEHAYAQARDVLLPLGEYFQVQDDYLDCFGDPTLIGKIGTDIEDNKCSWLINRALSIATPEQRRALDENYGKKDSECARRVKEVYQDMGLRRVYEQYEERSYRKISGLIEAVDEKVLPRKMFTSFMNRIYKRSK
ncbi:geranyltranstransferase [Cladochytrium replicatum]|nr:geranyltranstransferase [Cladochytrium replicatum]